jgi:putative transposase
MRKSNFNESQRLSIIAEQDAGKKVEEICRQYQISPATFYKWKQDLSDQQDDDRRRVKQLEQENARLKKMYAELRIDHEILQEGYEVAIVPRRKRFPPSGKRKIDGYGRKRS